MCQTGRHGGLQYVFQPLRQRHTWTPGVEQQVEVGAGILLGPLHAGASGDGHIGAIQTHDRLGVRCDSNCRNSALHPQDLALPGAALPVTQSHDLQGSLLGGWVRTWNENREDISSETTVHFLLCILS